MTESITSAATPDVTAPVEESLDDLYENAPCGHLSTTLDGVVIDNSIVGDDVSIANTTITGSILSGQAAIRGAKQRLNLGATASILSSHEG